MALQTVSDVLTAWLARNAAGHPAWQWVGLVRMWPDVVGETLARVSAPVRLQDRILTVQVVHPVWLAELRAHVDMLLQNIRARCPWCDVVDIHLEVRPARRERPERVSPPLQAARLAPELESLIETMAHSIPDARLRRYFIRACRAYWRARSGFSEPAG